MQKNSAILIIVCVMMCLTFNYTFPLHRDIPKLTKAEPSLTNGCKNNDIAHPHKTIADRTKKMANNIENAFKNFGHNIIDRKTSESKRSDDRNNLSEEDLRQYEQLVIMKKYPYLDLKELELKFSPSNKHARHNIKFESGPNLGYDPSICEPLEDNPNVEIINRGLSGFAIPRQSKRIGIVDKEKLERVKSRSNVKDKDLKDKDENILVSLKEEVTDYTNNKKIKDN